MESNIQVTVTHVTKASGTFHTGAFLFIHMPNHIKNRLILHGTPEQVKEVVEQYSTFYPSVQGKSYDDEPRYKKGGAFGFLSKEGIFRVRDQQPAVGVPEGWEPDMEKEFTRFPDFSKVIPPPDHPAYRDEPNQEAVRDSPFWWYNWNCDNWGTKWNAYSCTKEAENIYFFETAWSSVPEIITVMSLAFPAVSFQYDYADEDTGSNTGSFTFLAGEMTGSTFVNGSTQAYEMAFELRPGRKEDYVLVDGEYQYKDEE